MLLKMILILVSYLFVFIIFYLFLEFWQMFSPTLTGYCILSVISVASTERCLHIVYYIVAANRDTLTNNNNDEIHRTTVNRKRGVKTSLRPDWIAVMQLAGGVWVGVQGCAT